MYKKAKNRLIIFLFLLLALVFYMAATLTAPEAVNERRLSETLSSQPAGEIVSLCDLTDFEWDSAYTFSPYTSHKDICSIIGVENSKLKLEAANENMVQLIFTKDGEIVCVLLGYPNNLGYSFDYGQTDYKYLVFSSSNEPVFRTEHIYSDQILLRYMPKVEAKD